MGSTSWSDDHYRDRVILRAKSGSTTFAYDADVKSGKKTAKAAPTLDAKANLKMTTSGFKGRESRDSAEHPTSLAIITMLDVTGSMATVPQIVQQNLPKLMGLLTRKGYVEHPHILTMAIGDASTDQAPLQVGQFEAGIEIENDLTNLFLEGNGGGQQPPRESYDLGMYFVANHTATDCFDKRGKKGYVFIMGDEMPYDTTTKEQIEEHIDTKVEADVKLEDTLAKLKERYHVFFILPNQTSHYNDHRMISRWTELLGDDHFFKLENPTGICELIASIIGTNEGETDLDDIEQDLKDMGTDDKIRKAVGNALATVDRKSGGKLVKKGKGSEIAVAESGAGSGIATL